MKHPIQPIEKDEHGTLRFKANQIVRYLLDTGRHNMNDLARLEFPTEDRVQFAQLIGYSLNGYGELRSYVSDFDYEVASAMAQGAPDERDARIAYLEGELSALREGLAEPIARLYEKHPDDLIERD